MSVGRLQRENQFHKSLLELAFELHDGPTQILSAALMDLEAALGTRDLPEDAVVRIRAAQAKLRSGLADLRRLIRALEGENFLPHQTRSLAELVQELADDLRLREVTVRVAMHGRLEVVPGTTTNQAWRIIQEATSNALRHGKAKTIWLSALVVGETLQICVRDFGVGFEPEKTCVHGIGLRSMAERAARRGGQLWVESSPGRGTRVFAELPISSW
ncbi:MAG: histidine kinase [Thermoguttaceae bacterium]|nr:histidine kinase [Thermoguttaceae bacterium]MDW8078789.1 histidine kinase [Thermoguttaceae bacterium]